VARTSTLLDAWGVIYQAEKTLPTELKVGFLEALNSKIMSVTAHGNSRRRVFIAWLGTKNLYTGPISTRSPGGAFTCSTRAARFI